MTNPSISLTKHCSGTFFALNGDPILRSFGGDGREVEHFQNAIQVGLRFFDGAYVYGDGPKIAEALKGKKTEEFILASKIPGSQLRAGDFKQSTLDCFKAILERRNTDKLDILYLHGPDCLHKEVLDTLVELKEQEKIQYIGLCNVDVDALKALVGAGYPIGVVQNEINPFYRDEQVVDFCKEQGIAMVGYRPFGEHKKDEIFQKETLHNIARRVGSSVQDVILQWVNQKGITPIFASGSRAHIESNYRIPEWSLTDKEMKAIDSIRKGNQATCEWQQFANNELWDASRKWLESLVNGL